MLGYDTPLVYFAVPDGYTIGREFLTLPDALDFARSKVEPIQGCDGSYTRAFVNVRLADRTGDKQIHRIEVFHDGWISVPEGKGGVIPSQLTEHQIRLNAWVSQREGASV